MRNIIVTLREHGVRPSTQRVAVASYVLLATDHPSANQVFARVRRKLPVLSRATVYNALNLFVRRGLLRELSLEEGKVRFDPKTSKHHHFIDERTGAIHDVPWEALEVARIDSLKGFQIREYEVVMRGKKTARSPGRIRRHGDRLPR